LVVLVSQLYFEVFESWTAAFEAFKDMQKALKCKQRSESSPLQFATKYFHTQNNILAAIKDHIK